MPLQATSGAASYDAFGGGVAAVPQYIEEVFSTYLYTGNGSTQTITNGLDLVGKGGLVWIKDRTQAAAHVLVDTQRGPRNQLASNQDTPQYQVPSGTDVTSFDSSGFSLGSNWSGTNSNNKTYASWAFRKQPKFYTQGTYTGTGSTQTITHDLGTTPGFIIIKGMGNSYAWICYHRSLGATKFLALNSTQAAITTSTPFNNSEPTSTTFTVGTSNAVNESGQSFVYYAFAHDAGGFGLTGTDNVISCGSATATVGTWTDVNVGFEPQWVLIKNSTATGSYNPSGSAGSQDWYVIDTMRGATAATGSNTSTVAMSANSSIAEYNDVWFGLTSTGFSFKGVTGGSDNFIYIAIRRGPMKVPTSGTSVYETVTSSASAGTVLTTGFPVDLQMQAFRSTTGAHRFMDRLRGVSTNSTAGSISLASTSTAAETTTGSYSLAWNNTGFQMTTAFESTSGVFWNFKRAPSFFDEVCYTGTGSNRTVAHNLGAVPELMIVKRRNSTGLWAVYTAATGAANVLELQSTNASTSGSAWNSTSPTASVFTVGNTVATGASGGTYVAYLFATCAGVSKCTSFTGTGTLQTIDCGFTAGSRFVLIKRTDSTGDWYVWDSSRGLSSSTDPYLLLNSTAAEVTSTNWVDTTSTGFQVTAASGNNVNINGASYIALAIA